MQLHDKFKLEIAAFVAVCHRLAELQFTVSEGGNCAWRLDKGLILITPTQLDKKLIGPEDLVFIDSNAAVLEGRLRPTGETPMYLKFFSERPDVVSVIHCHPPYVCAAAILKGTNWLERPFFPETVIEVGPACMVPYGEPLTTTLADNFAPFLQKYNSFIMRNHGLVCMSRSGISRTMAQVELLEASARSIYIALQCGDVEELDRSAMAGLERVMTRRKFPLPGAPGAHRCLADCYFPAASEETRTASGAAQS